MNARLEQRATVACSLLREHALGSGKIVLGVDVENWLQSSDYGLGLRVFSHKLHHKQQDTPVKKFARKQFVKATRILNIAFAARKRNCCLNVAQELKNGRRGGFAH
jgi:hypothetical protein